MYGCTNAFHSLNDAHVSTMNQHNSSTPRIIHISCGARYSQVEGHYRITDTF